MKNIIKKLTAFGVLFLFLVISFNPTTGKINAQSSKSSSENLHFDKYINFLMKFSKMPSMAACAVHEDKVLWSKGYRYVDPETEKEATNETIFMVMSISKPFTATAIMQLYEQGLIDLDEDVNKKVGITQAFQLFFPLLLKFHKI